MNLAYSVLMIAIIFSTSFSINALNVDVSNLDLKNFKYFRYPDPQQAEKSTNFIENGANHVKAVYTYFRNVLVGDPGLRIETMHNFDPYSVQRNAQLYQKQFGYRGQNLVDLLGRGYSREELIYYGAIDQNFGRK